MLPNRGNRRLAQIFVGAQLGRERPNEPEREVDRVVAPLAKRPGFTMLVIWPGTERARPPARGTAPRDPLTATTWPVRWPCAPVLSVQAGSSTP